MPDRTPAPRSPTGAAARIHQNRGVAVDLVRTVLLQQDQKSVPAHRSAGEVKNIFECAGVAVGISSDGDEISAVGEDEIGSAAQLDVFVRGIDAGRIEEDLIDEELAADVRSQPEGGEHQSQHCQAQLLHIWAPLMCYRKGRIANDSFPSSYRLGASKQKHLIFCQAPL